MQSAARHPCRLFRVLLHNTSGVERQGQRDNDGRCGAVRASLPGEPKALVAPLCPIDHRGQVRGGVRTQGWAWLCHSMECS